MSKYEELVRNALESGEYKASAAAPRGAPEGPEGAGKLRSFLRSKMEWIVEREGCDMNGKVSKEDGQMKLAKFVKFREEKFGGVLFETKSEKVYTLSSTGAAVVREIVAGGTSTVIDRLKERYEDKTGSMEKEALAFISSLKEKGLVTE